MGCCESKKDSHELNNLTPGLLSSIRLGKIKMPNRIVHAAMTRGRCNPSNSIPNDLLVEYYTMVARNGCKFILTECAGISADNCFKGNGFCHTFEQMKGWKKVVDSVHKEGAKIYLQVFHGGRANHPKNSGGMIPISPSPIAIRGKDHTMEGLLDHVQPREITLEEMERVCADFKSAARNAIDYGFDGIQLHCANGYLLDQFLRSHTNQRKDNYGTTIQNRIRFPLEVIDACINEIGAERVGVKISPVGRYNDMFDERPYDTFCVFIKELNKRNIGFLEMMGPDTTPSNFSENPEDQIENVWKTFRPFYQGLYIANSKFDFDSGNKIIKDGDADLVSFGTKFISNPDLIMRFERGLELNYEVNWGNVFFGGAEGYLDYPYFEEFKARKNE